MRRTKIITILVSLLLLANSKSFSQVEASVYAGLGTWTNLGGPRGIGTEIKYKTFSFSFATGGWIIMEDVEETKRLWNLDMGVKFYNPKQNFFLGINYGTIGRTATHVFYDFYNKERTVEFKNYFRPSFSVGWKFTIYNRFYGMGYVGAASDYLSFLPKDQRVFPIVPRFGFMIGYTLWKNEKNSQTKQTL